MIREATIDDVAEIAALGVKFFAEAENDLSPKFSAEKTAQFIIEMIMSDEASIIVGTNSDYRIVGVLGNVISKPFFSDDITVHELFWYVDKGYRGSIGRRLLKALEDRAMGLGATFVSMSCMTHPMDMDSYYKRNGYSIFEKTYVRRL